eukprot:1340929-Lingulodinium_polyedra.AAC.1
MAEHPAGWNRARRRTGWSPTEPKPERPGALVPPAESAARAPSVTRRGARRPSARVCSGRKPGH